jgi:small subunit ribosomal protein S2
VLKQVIPDIVKQGQNLKKNKKITVEQLLESGAHIGHPTSRWDPNFLPYIATKKNGIHIINLQETINCIEKAKVALLKLVQSNGNILFVGTKNQVKDVVSDAADKCGMFYIIERWLGGILTNFATIKKSIKRLEKLEKESSAIYKNLTKKEMSQLERERIKLSDLHRGIKDMKYLPDALFVVDIKNESIAVDEAKILGIPVFGIVDSNTNPKLIDYPIPANDDSIKTVKLILSYLVNAININNPNVADEKKKSKVRVVSNEYFSKYG